nr:Uncharacterised protein [Klebsiella pneumoniae]
MTVLSSDLLLKVNLPKVNALSQTNPNTELLAAQLIVSQKDRRPADGLCPGIPEDVVLITNLKTSLCITRKAPCVALSAKSRTTTAWRLTSPAMMTMSLKSTA